MGIALVVFTIWFLIIQGPGPTLAPEQLARVGFRDYYRQFDDIDEEELNPSAASAGAREKALALERVPDLDLSGTEWPDLPNSEVVNAAISRRAGASTATPTATRPPCGGCSPSATASTPERIVLGNGAAELLQAAALALLSAGDEL